MLEEFETRHRDEFEKVLELLTKEMKAEAAAERARQKVLEASKDIEKNQKKKVFASDKLKDAEFLGENSTLLIVEGDSAAASMAMARDITKIFSLVLPQKTSILQKIGDLVIFGAVAQADSYRTGFQGASGAVGQGRAVEPGPQGD